MRSLCNGAGVAFVLVPRLAKTSVSGAARWLSPRKALIQQSDRYKTNDHFWFTFFHEAAHIILHSKRDVFVDEVDGPYSKGWRRKKRQTPGREINLFLKRRSGASKVVSGSADRFCPGLRARV